jgi:hypothetical protein|tara:strand:- start:923 stop:1105 length:183 start_codon:yes stop_codon:yes gene_type:complete
MAGLYGDWEAMAEPEAPKKKKKKKKKYKGINRDGYIDPHIGFSIDLSTMAKPKRERKRSK